MLWMLRLSEQLRERVSSFHNLQKTARRIEIPHALKTYLVVHVNHHTRLFANVFQPNIRLSGKMSSNKQHLSAHFGHLVKLFDMLIVKTDAAI